jgi:hypothetical protein
MKIGIVGVDLVGSAIKYGFEKLEHKVWSHDIKFNTQFECTAEMEKDAWPLQKKYLKEVHSYIWNYDELWYMVISDCGQY